MVTGVSRILVCVFLLMRFSVFFRTAFGLSAATNLLGLYDDPDLLTASRPVLPWETKGQKVEKGERNAEQVGKQGALVMKRESCRR